MSTFDGIIGLALLTQVQATLNLKDIKINLSSGTHKVKRFSINEGEELKKRLVVGFRNKQTNYSRQVLKAKYVTT